MTNLSIGILLTSQQVRAQTVPWRVGISSDINGQFASLDCTNPEPVALTRVASQFASVSESGTVLIDAGNLLSSNAVTRFALEHNTSEFGSMVSSLHLRAIAVGHRDLSLQRDLLIRAAAALREHSIPIVLSNLECNASAQAVCEALASSNDTPQLIESPYGRVAVVAAIAPSALNSIARDRSDGLQLLDPVPALTRSIAQARRAGATFVIAVYDPDFGNELNDGTTLANSFEAGEGPNLLVLHEVSRRVRFAGGNNVETTVVAARPGAVVIASAEGSRPVRDVADSSGSNAVVEYSQQLTRSMCDQYNRPLAGGVVAGQDGIGREEFGMLVTDILREVTRSEVGVLNHGAIRGQDIFPVRSRLTELEVLAALPFDNHVRVTRVQGDVLRRLLDATNVQELYIQGLTREDDRVLVNGRPLNDSVSYSVVTNDYIADGGDGGLGEDSLRFTTPFPLTLRDVVLRWLRVPRRQDVREAVSNPSRRTRWTFRSDLDVSFAYNSVDNAMTSPFTDTQLVRGQALSFTANADIRFDADHPLYSLENHLRVRYGLSQTIDEDGNNSGLEEVADLWYLRTAFTWRGFTSRRRWYIPMPFVESYLESEFTRPDRRAFHHLELRPVGGARFDLHPQFTVFGGLGFSWEMLGTPDGNSPMGASTFVPTLLGGVALRPTQLIRLGPDRYIDGELNFDALWRDWTGFSNVQLRGHTSVNIPIIDPIAISFSFDLFARYGVQPATPTTPAQQHWGVAIDTTIGLNISYTRSLQGFMF